MKNTTTAVMCLLVFVSVINQSFGGSITLLDACIQNCAQCQETLDMYFNGKLCADTCIKFKGKSIPDCESFESISPYLVKIA